jgi:hypothetical protein
MNRRKRIQAVTALLLVTVALLGGYLEYRRVRRVMLTESISSSFEYACTSKLLPCDINKSVEFYLPLSDKFSESKLSYLQYLPSGRYLLVSYEVGSKQIFSVLRVDVYPAVFVCSGYVR